MKVVYVLTVSACAFWFVIAGFEISRAQAHDTHESIEETHQNHDTHAPEVMTVSGSSTHTPRVIHASVVALDQPLVYNRFGSLNPYGMIYALERDVQRVPVSSVTGKQEWTIEGLSCEAQWQLKSYARARPLVLRGNVGDTLELTFTNSLLPFQPDLSKNCRVSAESPYSNLLGTELEAVDPAHAEREDAGVTAAKDARGNDWPASRGASIMIQGVRPVNPEDTRCTGLIALAPGETITCQWHLEREGTFMFYSSGAPAGGEGDGGSIVQGLFGTVNVEPAGSQWYRSQVGQEDLDAAWPRKIPGDVTDGSRNGPLAYNATFATANAARGIEAGDPVLNLLKPLGGERYELIYGDLNAIIHEAPPQQGSMTDAAYQEAITVYERAPAFREFTAIFHDELKTFYANAFTELETNYQLEGIGDGFGLNYGASGMGSMLIANRKGIGPSWNCAECFYEEFFLQSWVNGDPALLENYKDDPANVYHSYLNDRVVFRNLHAGPKETHVFHLHSHQWLSASDEDAGSYLDSQTIGPLQGFAYDIYKGGKTGEDAHDHTQGSGNRNRTPGDSIFHCHLYPHFAQGMWALWRVHDVLEDGSRLLPDGQPAPGLSLRVVDKTGAQPRAGTNTLTGESSSGTPIPAVVPLPAQALPPLPTYGDDGLAGYPFYIPGQAGHRAPQPPLDFAKNPDDTWRDGGLPRHVVTGGERGFAGLTASETASLSGEQLLQRALALGDMSGELESATLQLLSNAGEPSELRAMAFHAGTSQLDLDADATAETLVSVRIKAVNGDETVLGASADYSSPRPEDLPEVYENLDLGSTSFQVNNNQPQAGAPYADPCKDYAYTQTRSYDVSAIRLDMVVNKEGWHDPQARINVLDTDVARFEDQRTNEAEPFFFRAESGECIVFRHTNRTPKDLALDDFQMKTPTDIIGQHIHLVKFDVTSSDGSANGFNYEDGTFAADAVLERKCAAHAHDGAMFPDVDQTLCEEKNHDLVWEILKENPLNFQTTTQRWFSDPILSAQAPGTSLASNLHGQKTVTIDGREYSTRMPFTMTPLSPNHSGQMDHANMAFTTSTSGEVLASAEPASDASVNPDRTLRTVFTHDHFAASSIQQHGFYSALLIEPVGSIWCYADKRDIPDTLVAEQTTQEPKCPPDSARLPEQAVGSRALIVNALDNETHPDHREFALAVADFALLYDPRTPEKLGSEGMSQLLREAFVRFGNAQGLSSEDRRALWDYAVAYWVKNGLPVDAPLKPEAISKNHHNPYMVNYRLEPIPLRIGANTYAPEDTNCGQNVRVQKRDSVKQQRDGETGDLAFVFQSAYHGDPCTPILEAYEGERVQIRLIQGAQEVQHMFSLEGLYWPRVVDYALNHYPDALTLAKEDNALAMVAAQEIGISEHFEMTLPALGNVARAPKATDYLYHFGTIDSLWNGAWGLLRSYNGVNVPDPVACQAMSETDRARLSELLGFEVTRWDAKRNAFEAAGDEQVGQLIAKYCKRDDSLATVEDRLIPLPSERPETVAASGKIILVNEEEMFGAARTIYDVNYQPIVNIAETTLPKDCPSGSRFVRYEAVATRREFLAPDTRLYYDKANGLYDPNALLLLPLENGWRDKPNVNEGEEVHWNKLLNYLRLTYQLKAERGQLEPFILRVNAGDCVELKVYNALLSPTEVLGGKTTLPDASGDALMPKIVPLNVDKDVEHADVADVRPSSKLALSIPLVASNRQTLENTLPVGMNSTQPVSASSGALQATTQIFYAGLIETLPVQREKNGSASCLTDAQPGTPEWECAYRYEITPYAFGPIPIKAFGDIIGQGVHGLTGAVIVEPQGSSVLTPKSLSPVHEENRHTLGLSAVIRYCEKESCTLDDEKTFREFVVLYQDGLNWHWRNPWNGRIEAVQDCRVCDDSYDLGEKGVSYRAAPFWARLNQDALQPLFGAGSNLNHAAFPPNFFSNAYATIPTPTYVALEGDEVRFRVVQPSGRARQRAFVVSGYDYQDMMPEFGSPASVLMSAGKAFTARLETPDVNGDGVADGVQAGCYLYRDGPAPFFAGGVWGSFLVQPKDGSALACSPQ